MSSLPEVELDTVSCSALISACEKASQWSWALNTLGWMRELSIESPRAEKIRTPLSQSISYSKLGSKAMPSRTVPRSAPVRQMTSGLTQFCYSTLGPHLRANRTHTTCTSQPHDTASAPTRVHSDWS